ncbi:MAG: SsgA family sporulation/cell division regulator [Nocardioides sp.]
MRSLTEPVGVGDVRPCPGLDDDGRAVVRIELLTPEGQPVTEAPTEQVYRFLSITFLVVPAGSEHEHLDVDAMIERLLEG